MPKPIVTNELKTPPSLNRRFLVFLLPLIATNILQNLSMTINTIYVGQLLSVNAVAAIAVFMPVMFCLTAFIIGLSAGATIVVGQAFGAKNKDKLQQGVGTTLFVTIFFGIIIGIFGAIYADQILTLLDIDPDIHSLALPYFLTMTLGFPLIFSYLVMTSVLRGIGDSTTPLFALSLTIATGLIVTPALIQGWFGLPQLGTMAPALATLLGNLAAFIFLGFYLRYKQRLLQLNYELLKHIIFNWPMLKVVLRLGIPTGVQLITTSLAGLIIIRLINGFGSDATAAYGAITQVVNYIQFPALSIAIAASIFAAQAIGAKHNEELRKITRTAQNMNFIITGSLIFIAYMGSRYLMAAFITDPAVIDLAQSLLHITLWTILLFGAGAIFSSVMRASGTVWVPMLINLSLLIILELPLAYLLSDIYGLNGIWYAYAATFIAGGLLQWAYYQGVWRKKTIKALI
jgi:putative MATE family efflux protein